MVNLRGLKSPIQVNICGKLCFNTSSKVQFINVSPPFNILLFCGLLFCGLLFCGLFATIAIASIKLLRTTTLSSPHKTILFSYILLLISLALFNTVDVSIFDFRVNVFSWVLLSCLKGVSFRDRDISKV